MRRRVEFVRTQKPSKKAHSKAGYAAVLDNYSFEHDKVYTPTSTGVLQHYWHCSSTFCHMRVITNDDGDVLKESGDHDHDPPIHTVAIKIAQDAVRQQANSTNDKPLSIASAVLLNFDPTVTRPTSSSLQQIVRRERKKYASIPALPANSEEFEVPAQLHHYQNGRFYRGSCGISRKHHVFASEEGLDLLVTQQNWFGDGTFKVTPGIFYQLYVIHVQWFNSRKTVPVMYILMSGKSKEDYLELFKFIKTMRPDCDPESYTSDFESACMLAFESTFPDAAIRTCYFHLMQSFRRKADGVGLKKLIRTDANIGFDFRKLRAITFLPVSDMRNVWDTISAEVDQRFLLLINWFEGSYIGKKKRANGRSKPRFHPDTWSVFDRTLNGQHRTNNAVEGTNNALRKHFGVDHPNPWTFIRKLKDFQVKVDVMVNELKEKGPPKKKKRYAEDGNHLERTGKTVIKRRKRDSLDEQQSLCQRYDEFEPIEFLKQIAKTM